MSVTIDNLNKPLRMGSGYDGLFCDYISPTQFADLSRSTTRTPEKNLALAMLYQAYYDITSSTYSKEKWAKSDALRWVLAMDYNPTSYTCAYLCEICGLDYSAFQGVMRSLSKCDITTLNPLPGQNRRSIHRRVTLAYKVQTPKPPRKRSPKSIAEPPAGESSSTAGGIPPTPPGMACATPDLITFASPVDMGQLTPKQREDCND